MDDQETSEQEEARLKLEAEEKAKAEEQARRDKEAQDLKDKASQSSSSASGSSQTASKVPLGDLKTELRLFCQFLAARKTLLPPYGRGTGANELTQVASAYLQARGLAKDGELSPAVSDDERLIIAGLPDVPENYMPALKK